MSRLCCRAVESDQVQTVYPRAFFRERLPEPSHRASLGTGSAADGVKNNRAEESDGDDHGPESFFNGVSIHKCSPFRLVGHSVQTFQELIIVNILKLECDSGYKMLRNCRTRFLNHNEASTEQKISVVVVENFSGSSNEYIAV